MVRVQTIEEELKKVPELRVEDIRALREWAKLQPHLPNMDDIPDVYLSLFLRRRYYSLERAKQTLDNFLTFRTIVPEICNNRTSSSPDIQRYSQNCYILALDKLDNEENGVTILAMRDDDPSKFEFEASMKVVMTQGDAWYNEHGTVRGITMVLDQKHITLTHIAKLPLAGIKKVNYWNKHCAPVSIKTVYIINATPLVSKILTFLQPLLDGELFDKIRTFTASQMEEFHKCVPKDALPTEYGGTAGDMDSIHDKTMKSMQRNDDFIARLDRLTVNEKKRPGEMKNQSNMFGLEGSFKKLNVD